MHADEIRILLKATPFKPFTVYMPSEKSFLVPHPEFALLTQTGRTLVISYSDKEAVEILDVPLIARVEVQQTSAAGS